MNRTRTVLLGLFAVLLAVWVSSATLPPASAPPPPHVPTPKVARAAQASRQSHQTPRRDVTSFDLNEAAERLHTRIVTAPPAHATSRNPFEFGATPAPRLATAAAAPAMPAASPMTAGPPPPPPLALSGVAEQKNGDVLERTAILTGNNQIYFAKRGDRVLGRYEVTAVGSDAIELREIEGGTIVRLGLR